MTLRALVDSFSTEENLPISVDSVLSWIKDNTDHKIISLHEVKRSSPAYRGAFRRTAVPIGGMYSGEFEIYTDILYGADLSMDWKRLVIVKEALHVFDDAGACVRSSEQLMALVPAVLSAEIRSLPDFPAAALNDRLGVFKAMAVLVPEGARAKLARSVEEGSRTVDEVATYLRLPPVHVDLWLRFGEEMGRLIRELA
ncbi:hypothetical protein [Labrys sp. WJW]|uniref:hypothetical protein n=1 Tax=Labrys sp. WJW TaxID=1737983 RepID=UPI0012EA6974|nr:hypothetical protein [Labrys sp. WJW]